MILNKKSVKKVNINPEDAWEMLEDFAKYGFNKSHGVGYSLVSYRTAKIWTHNRDEFLEYSLNYDTKVRQQLAVDKCKELGYKFVYPDIFNMGEGKYIVKNNVVTVPVISGDNIKNYDSYVDFLFGETPDVYNLIYKGVCDKLTKDRYALSELVSTCLSKAKSQALFMEPRDEKFKKLSQILDGLKSCGGVTSWQKLPDGNIEVFMTRGRGEPSRIIFHKDESGFCKKFICKYDLKFFGKIRDGIISDRPYINTSAIELTLDKIKNRYKEKGLDNKIYYAMRDKLNEYMELYFNNPFKRIYEDIYAIVTEVKSYENSTRIFLSFNDCDDIFYVNGPNRKIVEKLDKNALVKMKLEYSPYINKRREEFVYDFDILEIEEV